MGSLAPSARSSIWPPCLTRKVRGARLTLRLLRNSRPGDRTMGKAICTAVKKPGGSWSMSTPTTRTLGGRRSKARFHSGIILWQLGHPLRKKSRTVLEPRGKSTSLVEPSTASAEKIGITSPTEGAEGGADAGGLGLDWGLALPTRRDPARPAQARTVAVLMAVSVAGSRLSRGG